MKAAILCTNGLEECEALVTYDLLFRANIEVYLIGLDNNILSAHNLQFKPHLLLADFNYQDFDCLILPGGMPGTKNLEANQKVSEIIDYFYSNDKYIAAICAAPSILNHKNLLKNEKFVCYPGFEEGLTSANAKAFVDNKIITAKGLGAAFEFTYEIIKVLVNEDKAKKVLNSIQY